MDGIIPADGNAVATAQTAVRASCVSAVAGSLDTAGLQTVELIDLRTVLTGAVAAYHSHLWCLLDSRTAQDCRHLLHCLIAADRAEVRVEIAGLDTGIGESTAAGETASSAVCTRHHLLDLVDPRIFLDLEFLSNEIQYRGENHSQKGDHQHGP